jgi:hypothetical protein
MTIITATQEAEEDQKFKATLSNLVKPCFEIKIKSTRE